jgi:hypothetical protein
MALPFAAEPLEISAAIDAAVVSYADATTSRRKRFIQLDLAAHGLAAIAHIDRAIGGRRCAVEECPLVAACRPTDGYDLTERPGWVRPNPNFFAIADLCAE